MSEGSGLDKAILGDVAMCLKTMLLNPDRGGDTKNEISLPDNPGIFQNALKRGLDGAKINSVINENGRLRT